MLKIILIILLIWGIWVGYQYHAKAQMADMLSEKKIQEFYSTDSNVLLERIGKGYEFQTVEIDGKKFWLSWLIYQKDMRTIEITGHVAFVELLPFSDFRWGHAFKFIAKMK